MKLVARLRQIGPPLVLNGAEDLFPPLRIFVLEKHASLEHLHRLTRLSELHLARAEDILCRLLKGAKPGRSHLAGHRLACPDDRAPELFEPSVSDGWSQLSCHMLVA